MYTWVYKHKTSARGELDPKNKQIKCILGLKAQNTCKKGVRPKKQANRMYTWVYKYKTTKNRVICIYNTNSCIKYFSNTDNIQFCLNSKANFSYFKQRLESKLQRGPTSHMFYQHPVFTGENQVTFYKVAVEDDEDL